MTAAGHLGENSGKRLSPDQRRQIFQYGRNGYTKAAVTRLMKVGMAAVKRWWPPADSTVPCFEDQPRSGRPLKFSPAERKAIKRQARDGASLAVIRMRLMQGGKGRVSKSTLSVAMKSGRRPLVYQRVKEVRVLRPSNKLDRMRFCSTFNAVSGPPMVFLDGKVFSLYADRAGKLKYRWAPVDAKPINVKGKQIAHLHFYAGVSVGWMSSLFFAPPSPPMGSGLARSLENFSSQHYTAIMTSMKKELDAHFKGKPYCIIRDRAPQHIKAEKSEDFSTLNLPIVKDYPAQSWDINCIEHVWAQLVMSLLGNRARTADGYRRVIQAHWRALPQSTIDKLVAEVPNRLLKISKLKGEWISHYQIDSFT